MRHLLIHSLSFPPDQVSTSYLYGDICKTFISSGFRVTVITTTPHFNYSESFKSHSASGLIWRTTNYNGALVYHFPHTRSKNLFLRAVNIFLFHLAFLLKAIMLSRFDVVLTSSPTITSGLVSAIVAKIKKAKSIYNVQEIYPDVLIKHMEIRQKWLISLMGQIEKITYRLTNKIVTIDQCFSNRIQNRLDPKKLSVIPNFIDTTLYKPFTGEIRSDFRFNDKFLVGYLGNLGGVQDWDCILEAIQLLETDDRFHFLIAGGGSEYNQLREVSTRLKNLTVLPYQPRTSIPELNHRVNLHMIAMDEASDYDGLPSKVYAILASGRPIIAATNPDSPLSSFLTSTQFATTVQRGNPKALADGIQSAFAEGLHLKSSVDIRALIENNYSKEIVTQMYVELANHLITAHD